jgi:hypothetical protein
MCQRLPVKVVQNTDTGPAIAYHRDVRINRLKAFTRSRASRNLVCISIHAVFIAAIALPVAARELATDSGAIFDLPSGFTAEDSQGKSRYSYVDANAGMEFDILVFPPDRYDSAEKMAADLLGQMGSKGESLSFPYQGLGAVMADLAFTVDGHPRKGYAVFICGAGASKCSYALIASAETARFDGYAELIISCLDAFSIDRTAHRFPGPVSQFLLPLPATHGEMKTVALPAGTVSLPWSSKEAQEELALAQREFHVLTMYLKSETLWQDAWARYYRMVFKESSAQLDTLTKAFAGFERRGDCDSRAMLMAIILEHLGIDCILMVSREYSHAMLAVDVPGGGQRFTFNGKAYLVAETTARVGIGTIDASQIDPSKWLGVDLGE